MNVKFTMTTAARLPELAVTNGQLVYLQDQDEAYYDMNNTRKRVGGVQKVTELPSTGRDGTIYVIINADGKADASIWNTTTSSYAPLSGYAATTTSLGLVQPDGTTITISDGVISASGSSVAPATTATAGIVQPDGDTITVDNSGVITALSPNNTNTSKRRYTITSTSWSAEPNASGYYTYTLALHNQSFNLSTAVNLYIAGSTDSTVPTDTEKSQYALVDMIELTTTSSVTLYATTKPSSTFYVYIGADGGYTVGGGGTYDYTELDNQPSINNVTLVGNVSLSTLGLGTAATKDSTSSVTSGSTALVESGAVKTAIDAAVASAYHHAGTKTVAQLTNSLLVAANEGNVYNITDSGTTTADFIEGAGKPISEGDNVGIAKISDGVFKFDLLSGLVDTSTFITKSATTGLVQNDGSIDTSKHVHLQPTSTTLSGSLSEKEWSGITDFNGQYIWTDGDNIYYSNSSSDDQYVLDKSTSTWSAKTWSEYSSINGFFIWTDGENIYYSNGSDQYVLDKSTSTWSAKTWTGYTNIIGYWIWTDGDNIYYSAAGGQYVLDKSTSTWSTKTWSGLTSFDGNRIWTDGDNIYYSYNDNQYVLDKSTSTWSPKTWTGLTSLRGDYIWTDGENIYYSKSTDQYVLDKSTSTWSSKTWSGYTSIDGRFVWTDGTNIYYSYSSTQYVFDATASYADGLVRSDGTIDQSSYLTSADLPSTPELLINPTAEQIAQLPEGSIWLETTTS